MIIETKAQLARLITARALLDYPFMMKEYAAPIAKAAANGLLSGDADKARAALKIAGRFAIYWCERREALFWMSPLHPRGGVQVSALRRALRRRSNSRSTPA